MYYGMLVEPYRASSNCTAGIQIFCSLIYLFSSIVDPSLWHTPVSAWTRSKQACGEQSCTVEDFLVTISIGYSVRSKSLINMFQGSNVCI